jgi:C1q domain
VKRVGEYTNNNNAVIITYGTRITPHPAMDSTTGVFTVPISGTYFFHYHSYAYTRSVAGGTTSQRTKVSLLLNGEEVTFNYADSDNPTDVTMAFTATLKLVAGDHISTRFEYGNIRDANFGGSLIEADVDFSL